MKFRDVETNEMRELPEGEEVRWRPSVYGVIQQADKVLMILEPTQPWQLPGGGIDDGETIDQALEREVYEETGYRAKKIDDNPLFTHLEAVYFDRWKHPYRQCIGISYNMELVSEERNPNVINSEFHEIEEVGWKELSELTAENTHRMHWPLIERLKNDL